MDQKRLTLRQLLWFLATSIELTWGTIWISPAQLFLLVVIRLLIIVVLNNRAAINPSSLCLWSSRSNVQSSNLQTTGKKRFFWQFSTVVWNPMPLFHCFEKKDLQLMGTCMRRLSQPRSPSALMRSSQWSVLRTFPNQKPWVNGSVRLGAFMA